MRGFTIMYSKPKAQKYRDEEKLLHKKANGLQARAENNLHKRNILLELQRARHVSKKSCWRKPKAQFEEAK